MDETQPLSPDSPSDLEQTDSHTRGAFERSETESTLSLDIPSMIGRYRIVGRLRKGGFGQVYLAHDDDLRRPVAIKVPAPGRIARPRDVELYLNEARIVASLNHPHIVPVYDLGRTDDGVCYVVSKYVAGGDLAARLKESRPGVREVAELVALVAEALHYAHSRGLVHRDIKPDNILIDTEGRAFVADFGLALRDEDFGRAGRFAGTPAYMSPEQARGEGHRVDGRSDVFSLGVVLYELLTGRRPFVAQSREELLGLITLTEPRPPRQIDDRIPKELERICLKSLSKRVSERYTTARDMAEDLRHFLQAASEHDAISATHAPVGRPTVTTRDVTPAHDSGRGPHRIVPKGLRSFDEQDADFFMDLLPGPRDRHGLPESLRFWKSRIESGDPVRTFRVGLLYGPSGCGKSSLFKAGLLPRLAEHVLPVFIEATAEATETRLSHALRQAGVELPGTPGLVETLSAVRAGRCLLAGRKLLIVLDQFEQWLHARRGEENTVLVRALRQCDGSRVQAIVMVRDDFWMATTRFMDDVEVEPLQGRNVAAVDLFDLRHARKVLTAFGIAHGALPEPPAALSRDRHAFLEQAIAGLAQDGKVISVRLALFAEMFKGKPWTPVSLREVGGTEGVGVSFLEETFMSPHALPAHRQHREAAQVVLKALLPETGTEIKGQMRSESELRQASGLADRPREFHDLLHILDGELRLITPTDPEGPDVERPSATSRGRYYQLTHDYLVPALRDWLTQKQRETRRGRAALRLEERGSLWIARPENRHLPSPLEFAKIRALTRRRDWTESQRRMMRRAGRVLGLRAAVASAVLGLLAWVGIESYGTLRASSVVESLRTAGTTDVPTLVRQLAGYRRWADPRLKPLLQGGDPSGRETLHAALALLPVDDRQVPFLERRLLDASPIDLPVIRDALKPHRAILVPKLWSTLERSEPSEGSLLRAAAALADYDPTSPRWASSAGGVAQALVTVNPVFLGPWLNTLRPVRGSLNAPLAAIFRDANRRETEHALATNILSDYASDDPALLADLLMDADPGAYAVVFPLVQRLNEETTLVFRAELGKTAIPTEEPVPDRLTKRQARGAVALVRMGGIAEVLPLLRFSAAPQLRGYLINWLGSLGADPVMLAAELDRLPSIVRPSPEDGQSFMDAVLFHPENSQRRALILALGACPRDAMGPEAFATLTKSLLDFYRDDPDGGIHSAAAWTLNQWGRQADLLVVDAELMSRDRLGDRRWFMNAQSQTFAVIEGPVEFLMGSRPAEPDRMDNEDLHTRIIHRRFAVATTEVSVREFKTFLEATPGFKFHYIARYSPDEAGAQIEISWYDAAAYCNWLSRREGLPECYMPNPSGEYAAGMTIKPDALRLDGYRLPTEAEWEYACRAGTTTSRHYGTALDLLARYAWYSDSSRNRAWPCGTLLPNELGLFDMLGNVLEWGQSTVQHFPDDPKTRIDDPDPELELLVDGKHTRLLRGGSFGYSPAVVRSAFRNNEYPDKRSTNYGFRLCRTLR